LGGYSVVIEKEDFDAAGAVDDFGEVALHGFDYVHCLDSKQGLVTAI